MIGKKTQIGIATVLVLINGSIYGINKHKQAEINTETEHTTKVLNVRQNQLNKIITAKTKIDERADPTLKSNKTFDREYKVISSNAEALFKLLYSTEPNESEAHFQIRKSNWEHYVTPQAAAETGHTGDIKDAKKYQLRINHVATTVSLGEKKRDVYDGIIRENSIQSSNNYKGSRNQEDWYYFSYDFNQQKFTKFTLLGFNFDNE